MAASAALCRNGSAARRGPFSPAPYVRPSYRSRPLHCILAAFCATFRMTSEKLSLAAMPCCTAAHRLMASGNANAKPSVFDEGLQTDGEYPPFGGSQCPVARHKLWFAERWVLRVFGLLLIRLAIVYLPCISRYPWQLVAEPGSHCTGWEPNHNASSPLSSCSSKYWYARE